MDKTKIIIGILIVVALVFVLTIKDNRDNNPKISIEAFSNCLNNSGAVMYGTSWCHYCNQQKTMFGPSFKYINFVDCDINQTLCRNNGITGYPTWIIKGTPYSGVQEFSELSTASGCPYN